MVLKIKDNEYSRWKDMCAYVYSQILTNMNVGDQKYGTTAKNIHNLVKPCGVGTWPVGTWPVLT